MAVEVKETVCLSSSQVQIIWHNIVLMAELNASNQKATSSLLFMSLMQEESMFSLMCEFHKDPFCWVGAVRPRHRG